MSDLNTLTIADARDALSGGEVTSVELTEACLGAIGASGPLNAFVHGTPEKAAEMARAADARIRAGDAVAMTGIPVGIKDVFCVKGVPSQAASRILDGFTPEYESTVTQNLWNAGAVMLGKLNMDEFAMGSTNEASCYGRAVNPWKGADGQELTPGGSSGGSAAAVAADLCLGATGTDTGGSIRVPAAWNGLVGFKPTHDSLPEKGVVPLCRKFDVVGPIARTVEDCAELLAVMANRKAVDLHGAQASGLRLMVLDGLPFDDAGEGPVTAFQDAVERLARAGAQISHVATEWLDKAMALSPQLFAPEAYGIWRAQIEDAPELMWNPILERFRGGAEVSAPDYVAAWEQLVRIRRKWVKDVASSFDAVILPTVPILPPDAKRLMEDEAYFVRANLLTLRNTRIANLLGLPAATLPTGHPGCGIMMMGHAGRDGHLLRVAAAAETALDVD